jgi:carbon storage regulator
MLVLSRKPGEQIHIGDGILLTVVEIRGNRVRLSLEAPDDVRILRGELAVDDQPPVPIVTTKGTGWPQHGDMQPGLAETHS